MNTNDVLELLHSTGLGDAMGQISGGFKLPSTFVCGRLVIAVSSPDKKGVSNAIYKNITKEQEQKVKDLLYETLDTTKEKDNAEDQLTKKNEV